VARLASKLSESINLLSWRLLLRTPCVDELALRQFFLQPLSIFIAAVAAALRRMQ
jgi:hypothetical protein